MTRSLYDWKSSQPFEDGCFRSMNSPADVSIAFRPFSLHSSIILETTLPHAADSRRRASPCGHRLLSRGTPPWSKQIDPDSLYRCGALTEAGRQAILPGALEPSIDRVCAFDAVRPIGVIHDSQRLPGSSRTRSGKDRQCCYCAVSEKFATGAPSA